ncbi:MAG: hypothetical protein RSB38_01200 [Oscillospiraceae bacterium]
MKKIKGSLLVLATVCAVSLVGCGEKAAEPTTSPSASPAQTAVKSENVNMKTGMVVESTASHIYIEAPDGSTYHFRIDDKTDLDSKGDNLGDTVEVSYDGEYKDEMVAKKLVTTKVSETAATPKPTAEKATEKPATEKPATTDKKATATPAPKATADANQLKYVKGIVQNASMYNVSIKRHDGKVYNIKKDDNTEVDGNLLVGAEVEVIHKGNFKNGILATSIVVLSEPETKKPVEKKGVKKSEGTTVSGVIENASMNNIVIKDANGKTYSFSKSDDIVVDDNAEFVGKSVVITYTGKLESNPVATKIALK